MTTEVDICNIALGHLGDKGTVASLNPPEGSIQAEHCARFYPVARDTLLSAHTWGFATKRATLAQLATNPMGWSYAYTRPADALKILSVRAMDEPDPVAGGFKHSPHPYVCETTERGTQVIYCNVPQAIVHYVARVEVTETFTPLFTTALTWQLASLLAGPVIKGDEGRNEAKRCAQMAQVYVGMAAEHDASQRSVDLTHVPEWVGARGAAGVPNGWRR